MTMYRVVDQNEEGSIEVTEVKTVTELKRLYKQIGVEGTSCCLRLHGQPVFEGLLGPMSDGKSVIRYETPLAFVAFTRAWAKEWNLDQN